MSRIEKIAACAPAGIILREKDLTGEESKLLAEQVMEICKKYEVSCVLHSFIKEARELRSEAIHLPLPVLRGMTKEDKADFKIIGASCHSVDDAVEAETLGCTYITAGHIFATDCKKNLPPRGIGFLKMVCENVSVPVYAIGGINSGNMESVRNAGAKGACIMSGLMCCESGDIRPVVLGKQVK